MIAHVSWRGLHLLPKWRPTRVHKKSRTQFWLSDSSGIIYHLWLGQTESMADEDEFKRHQKIMAAKRAERNKPGKGKDRLVPEKLTIQRLSAQVKGSSQKYARMGPLKRVDVFGRRHVCITNY